MRKINKILSGVTAATLAFGSMAAYVAYAADNVKAAYPSSGDYTKFNQLNYTAEKDGNTITVNFPTQTKEQVEAIQTELGAGNSNGTAPIYLGIEVGSEESGGFDFLAGYGWDDGNGGNTHKDWNYKDGKMYLWLSATTESGYKVKYTLDKGTDETGVELTFNFTYKEADEGDETPSGGSSSSSSDDVVLEGESDEIEPGKDVEVEVDGLGTIVVETDAEDENLSGTTLKVETVSEGSAAHDLYSAVNSNPEFDDVVDEVVEKIQDGDAIIVDLSFVDENGLIVEPGKAVKITLPLPTSLASASTIYVYHVGEDGIVLIDECDVDINGTITFTATEFSPFVLSAVELENATVPKAETPTDDPTTEDPTTEDPTTSEPTEDPGDGNTNNPGTGIALAVAPVVLAAGAFAVATFKRKH